MITAARRDRTYKTILVLLVGLATISTARKDVNEVLTLARELQGYADRLAEILPVAQEPTVPAIEICSSVVEPEKTSSSNLNLEWTEDKDVGKEVQIADTSDNMSAESGLTRARIRVKPAKATRRGNPENVMIYDQHPGFLKIQRISRDKYGVSIGGSGREFFLKTFNGIISLRRPVNRQS